MTNKNYFAQLSPKEKAELFLIYTKNGMFNYNDIVNHYNSGIDENTSEEMIDIAEEDVEDNVEENNNGIPGLSAYFSDGGGIHIDKSKRGTFTAAATKHGMGVQAFAARVLANKDDYSSAMVKKANFARNAAKWHDDGGFVDARIQYLDKMGNYKKEVEIPYKYNDFSNIKTTGNRPYNEEYINYIDDGLKKREFNDYQRQAILANIIEESGGDPYNDSKTGFKGLLQWSKDRYWPESENTPYSELEKQLDYIEETARSKDTQSSWNKGFSGSGYSKAIQARNKFNNATNLIDAMHSFTWGYVRPAGKEKSYNNRLKVAKQVKNNMFN